MTTQNNYDHLVFIGRFSPFHDGHKQVVETALAHSKHLVILIGSANQSRNPRNPFTFEERKEMILLSIDEVHHRRLSIIPLNDYTYNDAEWIRAVQRNVKEEFRNLYPHTTYEEVANINKLKVGLIGHSKDHSSYYLKLFPTWDSIDVKGVLGDSMKLLNATDVRNAFFGKDYVGFETLKNISPKVDEFLHNWSQTTHYTDIKNEIEFVQTYKKSWENAPYAPTFVTTDAVVVQSGHVLLVKRRANPGKGKLALPGGFLNQEETLLDCAVRELQEETKIKVPEAVLRGSLKAQRTFDDPNRSQRGRTITTAFLFSLNPQTELPKVKGSDDAEKAMWVPLSELRAEDLFEDHYHIIQNLISTL